MRETKQMRTNNFTFRIDSQSWASRVFDDPSETTALLRLQSFIQVLCNPWNCLQMQLLPSAPSLPVSFVFGKLPLPLSCFFRTERRAIIRVLLFPPAVIKLEGMSLKSKERYPDLRKCYGLLIQVGFRKRFIRKTALFWVSSVNRKTKVDFVVWFLC